MPRTTHNSFLALLLTMGICATGWGGQSKPAVQPKIPQGGAPPVQNPIYRNAQQVPRPVVRPTPQPRGQQTNQLGRGQQQPVRQVGNQPQRQLGVRTGRQVGNQPQYQPGQQMGRGQQNQPGRQVYNPNQFQRGGQPGRQLGRGQQNPPGNQPGLRAGNQIMPAGGRTRTIQSMQFRGAGVGQVSKRPNGRIASIHTNRMNIDHGLHGTRKVVVRQNGRTLVATGRHSGYVERPYLNRGGHTYYERTYVQGGRTYARVYRGYDYHGARYYGYRPAQYYHPGFYAWAARPWGRPVRYAPAAWGWQGAPWYASYHVYFTPYPVYRAPAFWLTDFIIAANLQLAYQAGVEAGQQRSQPPDQPAPDEPTEHQYQPDGNINQIQQIAVDPQLKQQVAQEVEQQVVAEQSESQNPDANQPPGPGGDQVPDALNPSERVFIISNEVDTSLPTGQECSLTGGDMVTRTGDMPDANQNVTAMVASSKPGDCAKDQTVIVSVQDLQEMHNNLREQVDSGLQTLAQNGGEAGLPQSPDASTMASAIPPPAPDPGAANQLQAEQVQADQIEGQVPNLPRIACKEVFGFVKQPGSGETSHAEIPYDHFVFHHRLNSGICSSRDNSNGADRSNIQ